METGQCRVDPRRIAAPCLSKVGSAAAYPANKAGELADHFAGFKTVGQIRCYADGQKYFRTRLRNETN